jgi:integrase
LLGRGKRGERCKSGRDQGVVLDEPYCRDMLRRRICNLPDDAKIFNITADKYRRWWTWASEKVLGDGAAAGTPHSARHTGASRDLTEGYRSLEQVMKRGRWKALNSVHRYAKPHAWYEAKARVPDKVRRAGEKILASRPSRPQVAV